MALVIDTVSLSLFVAAAPAPLNVEQAIAAQIRVAMISTKISWSTYAQRGKVAYVAMNDVHV
jgi:hypothetical protein